MNNNVVWLQHAASRDAVLGMQSNIQAKFKIGSYILGAGRRLPSFSTTNDTVMEMSSGFPPGNDKPNSVAPTEKGDSHF